MEQGRKSTPDATIVYRHSIIYITFSLFQPVKWEKVNTEIESKYVLY